MWAVFRQTVQQYFDCQTEDCRTADYFIPFPVAAQ
jgi:hypothetical protein